MAHQPRLMIVVNHLPFLASHRKEIAFAALKQGYRVAIACVPNSMTEDFATAGFEIHELDLERKNTSPLGELKTVRSIRRAYRAFRPDVVYLVTSKPTIYGGILARLMGIPSLSAISGLGYIFAGNSTKQRILRGFAIRAYKAALNHRRSHVVFQNKTDLKMFLDRRIVRADQTTMVPGSGTDLGLFEVAPLPPGDPIIAVLPARMLRDKGVDEFIEAAALLCQTAPHITFRLLGDPDPMNPTTLSVGELIHAATAPNVEWRPFSDNIAEELAQAHLVVLPSYREGFPKSLIDAAAAGRAVATSNVPGCRDAIIENKTGVLFRVRDPVSLAHVVKALCNDRDLLTRMGHEGRRHAEVEFDVNRIVEVHMCLISKWLGLGAKF